MRFFGLEITRAKAAVAPMSHLDVGWRTLLSGDAWPGSWQANIRPDNPDQLLAFSAVFSCVTGIAQDVAKICLRGVQENEDGTCTPIPAASPLAAFFAKPNHFQDAYQFVEAFVLMRLTKGNTVGVKVRDGRRMVRSIYLLDWDRVKPLVAPSGEVFYQISSDHLAGLPEQVTLPAREVIHNRGACLFHPLIGVSPLYASGIAATMGGKITRGSAAFFRNMARPSGMLTADGEISPETAARLKADFEANYSEGNLGKIAVGGNGMKFIPIGITAADAELVKQLEWTVQDVARAFRYPLYKLGGPIPQGATTAQLQQNYYDECLQPIIESIESTLTDGLELPPGIEAEFDVEDLLRMDRAAQGEVDGNLVKNGIMAPNEARRRRNLPPVPGGQTPYLQQQNFSLAALEKRDAREDPFATSGGGAAPPASGNTGPAAANDPAMNDQAARSMLDAMRERAAIVEEGA